MARYFNSSIRFPGIQLKDGSCWTFQGIEQATFEILRQIENSSNIKRITEECEICTKTTQEIKIIIFPPIIVPEDEELEVVDPIDPIDPGEGDEGDEEDSDTPPDDIPEWDCKANPCGNCSGTLTQVKRNNLRCEQIGDDNRVWNTWNGPRAAPANVIEEIDNEDCDANSVEKYCFYSIGSMDGNIACGNKYLSWWENNCQDDDKDKPGECGSHYVKQYLASALLGYSKKLKDNWFVEFRDFVLIRIESIILPGIFDWVPFDPQNPEHLIAILFEDRRKPSDKIPIGAYEGAGCKGEGNYRKLDADDYKDVTTTAAYNRLLRVEQNIDEDKANFREGSSRDSKVAHTCCCGCDNNIEICTCTSHCYMKWVDEGDPDSESTLDPDGVCVGERMFPGGFSGWRNQGPGNFDKDCSVNPPIKKDGWSETDQITIEENTEMGDDGPDCVTAVIDLEDYYFHRIKTSPGCECVNEKLENNIRVSNNGCGKDDLDQNYTKPEILCSDITCMYTVERWLAVYNMESCTWPETHNGEDNPWLDKEYCFRVSALKSVLLGGNNNFAHFKDKACYITVDPCTGEPINSLENTQCEDFDEWGFVCKLNDELCFFEMYKVGELCVPNAPGDGIALMGEL